MYVLSALLCVAVVTLIIADIFKNMNLPFGQPQETPSPDVEPSPTPQEAQAEVIFYDKEPYEKEIVNYSDVILPQNNALGESYIDITLFVCDSNTEGLAGFGHLYQQNVMGKHSMAIAGVTEDAYIQIVEDNPETEEDESQYITMMQQLAIRQPARIIFNFGTNNAGKNASAEHFKSVYSSTIEQIKAACPNTQIVLAAILPVCEERSYMNIRQNVIDEFNLAIAQISREYGCGFLHYPEVFKDSITGYANSDYFSKDGVHLNGDGYRLLLDYVANHQYNTDI